MCLLCMNHVSRRSAPAITKIYGPYPRAVARPRRRIARGDKGTTCFSLYIITLLTASLAIDGTSAISGRNNPDDDEGARMLLSHKHQNNNTTMVTESTRKSGPSLLTVFPFDRKPLPVSSSTASCQLPPSPAPSGGLFSSLSASHCVQCHCSPLG